MVVFLLREDFSPSFFFSPFLCRIASKTGLAVSGRVSVKQFMEMLTRFSDNIGPV